MRFAYADPPYLGYGRYYADHHEDARRWDGLDAHRDLIERLSSEYPDGWALSASSPSLRVILPLCPDDARVAAWVKPFCSFKPNVNPAYAWEPVIWRGGRSYSREEDTERDWIAENITLQKGLTGAKPAAVCRWIFRLLNAERGDTFDDLFPGTGVFSKCWAAFAHPPEQLTLSHLTRG